MFDRDLWSEIFHSIRNNKLRTFLTGFSVAWGIFILVLLLASVNGLKNGFTLRFSKDASNSITIYPGTTSKAYAGLEKGRRIIFKDEDIEFIKKTYTKDYEYITPVYSKSGTTRYKNETGSYSVNAVDPDYKYIDKTELSSGRFINQGDILSNAKVTVIGRMVAEDLFDDEDPLGKYIQINKSMFRVIGVFTDDGNDREERKIYAPISTYQLMYGDTRDIDQIQLTYNPNFDLTQALAFSNTLEDALRRRLKIDPDDQGGIYLNNTAKAFSDVSKFTGVLSAISIGVGFLILIAGIVGIGNILVFIIKERTKEIGIRKALGAKPSQVIKLVLLESIFITTISGFVGLMFAMLIVTVVGKIVGQTEAFSDPSVDLSTVITATIILILAGVMAGLAPAIKAANVKPITALRAD
ncbi:ABC transporter permease [Zhouia sp. PK063]|uniref:ABC transporter permease n=1 Tax=Zhouia sp. PK063 TaxID=3373602 RepID=UPI0037A89A85